MIEENHEKKTSQVSRHRDLNPGPPEASLMRYHGDISLGVAYLEYASSILFRALDVDIRPASISLAF